jgi:hypothetical protein
VNLFLRCYFGRKNNLKNVYYFCLFMYNDVTLDIVVYSVTA